MKTHFWLNAFFEKGISMFTALRTCGFGVIENALSAVNKTNREQNIYL